MIHVFTGWQVGRKSESVKHLIQYLMINYLHVYIVMEYAVPY